MAEQPLEIATERRDEAPCSALEAFGRLRRYTPDRGTFLFESLKPDDGAGRYSIVGYRVRKGELVPPWSDWLDVFGDQEKMSEAESFAAGLAQAYVGAFTTTSPLVRMEIPVPQDAGPSAMLMAGATVLVFDHQDGSMTAAGPAKGNLVPRILYELEHGEDASPLAGMSAPQPEGLQAVPGEDKTKARYARAQGLLDEDELPKLVLARGWTAPLKQGDPFDIYRAWRATSGAPFGYFLDFGKTPMQGSMQVLGMGREVLHQRRPGDAGSSWLEGFAEVLPHPTCTGSRDPVALRIIAKLEDQSRELFGGTVGYIAPGGVAMGVLADEAVFIADDLCVVRTGMTCEIDGDPPEGALKRSYHAATPALTAIARAQAAASSSKA